MVPVVDDRFDQNGQTTEGGASEDQTPTEGHSTPAYDNQSLRQFSRDASSKKSVGRIVALMIVILALGGGYWSITGWKGLPDPDAGPPLVMAENGPVRVKPDDPGGLDIPHQDKLVYGHLDPNGAPQETVERLLPPPEISGNTGGSENEEKRKIAEMTADMPEHIAAPDLPAPDTPDVSAPRLPESPPSDTVSSDTVPSDRSPSDTVSDPAPTSEKSPPQSPPLANPSDTDPVGRDSATEKKPEAIGEKPVVLPGPEFFWIQLGSFRSDVAAQNGWKALLKEFPAIFSDLKREIVRADLGERGIYYRIQAGHLEKEAAQKICRQLSAQKKGCLVVKR